MEKSDVLIMPRRKFIVSASFLALGGRLFGIPSFSPQSVQEAQRLKEELTPEELELVKKSVMAQNLKNYFHEGYSCAESILMVSLVFLEKPKELVWAASGFGGGLYHKDLCGFLTGGIMAIGLSAGMLKKKREERKEFCKQAVKEYWKWWDSVAPFHCSEIRKKGMSPKVCTRIGQLASVKIEELIKPARSLTDVGI